MATTKTYSFILYVISLSFFQCCCFSFQPATKNLVTKSTQEQLRPSSVSLLSDDGTNNNEESLRRRIILTAPTAAILLSSNIANAAETTAESIRLLSSKTIPGLGPPDVYYPSYFVGKWKVTKVITTSDDNFWNDLTQIGVKLPVTIVSEMRFIPYDAGKDFDDSNNPNNVPAIADRNFNENSYYAALSKEINRLYQSTKSLPSIQTTNWTPTNPNVLSLAYSDGSSKEIKVTKRSSDVSKEGDNIFSSEFRRITDVPSSGSSSIAGGIPTISKSRVLTKWRKASTDNDDVIEGIEILYNEQGTLGEKNAGVDPLMGGRIGQDTKDLSDWRSTKTKILMERIV